MLSAAVISADSLHRVKGPLLSCFARTLPKPCGIKGRTRLSLFWTSLSLSLSLYFSQTARALSTSFPSYQFPSMSSGAVTYVDSVTAKTIDDRLMTAPGFSIDQLMELAGLSVACAAHSLVQEMRDEQLLLGDRKNVVIFCGPGNNGGDGLVAARHLRHFGYTPLVIYPKASKGQLFDNLVQQCRDLDIPVETVSPDQSFLNDSLLIIDALFGFSFKGPAREPFSAMINMFSRIKTPVLSVDIPSGWDVDSGDVHHTGFTPAAVISLTLPKLCMSNYMGIHYVGGRFMPPKLAAEMRLTMPTYLSSDQIMKLHRDESYTGDARDLSDRGNGEQSVSRPFHFKN